MPNWWDEAPVVEEQGWWHDAPIVEQPGIVEDVAKTIPAGLVRGTAGLAGLPGDLDKLTEAGIGYLMRKLGVPEERIPQGSHPISSALLPGMGIARIFAPELDQPTTADAIKNVESVTGPLYQPQTVPGQFANTASEFLPGAMLGGVGGMGRRALTQALLPAIGTETAGQATKGSPYEKWARLGGALAGGAVPGLTARAITPLPIPAARQASVEALQAKGITPTAGQATDRDFLKAFESEVGGQGTRDLMEAQKQAVNREALSTVGVKGTRADTDTINKAITQNSDEFNRLVAANNVTVSTPLMRDIMAAQRDYARNTATHSQVPVIQDVVTDISQQLARHGYLPGRWYQNLRADIGNEAHAAMNRGGSKSSANALLKMQKALDDAMEQSIAATNPADLGAFREARRQYGNLQHIIHSVSGKSGAAGNVDLERLRASQAAWDEAGYARGRGDLNVLTHAGQEVLAPYQNSGTAARTAARNAIPTAAATAGGLLGHSMGGEAGAAAGLMAGVTVPYLAKSAAGSAVTKPAVQAYLRNQKLAGRASNLGGDPWRAALIQALMAAQEKRAPLQIQMGPPQLPPTE